MKSSWTYWESGLGLLLELLQRGRDDSIRFDSIRFIKEKTHPTPHITTNARAYNQSIVSVRSQARLDGRMRANSFNMCWKRTQSESNRIELEPWQGGGCDRNQSFFIYPGEKGLDYPFRYSRYRTEQSKEENLSYIIIKYHYPSPCLTFNLFTFRGPAWVNSWCIHGICDLEFPKPNLTYSRLQSFSLNFSRSCGYIHIYHILYKSLLVHIFFIQTSFSQDLTHFFQKIPDPKPVPLISSTQYRKTPLKASRGFYKDGGYSYY